MINFFAGSKPLFCVVNVQSPLRFVHGDRIDVHDVIPSRGVCGPTFDLHLRASVESLAGVESSRSFVAGNERP